MPHTLKRLPKSTIELTIELTPADMQPYLQKAAAQLSQQSTIPGFRPGKAPYEEVVRRLGAPRLWEEAAQLAVPKTYSAIVVEEKLKAIGSPAIDVIKLAPDNPFIFKATVALLPEVVLGDYSKVSVSQKPIIISDAQVNKVLTDLQKMQTKEVVVDRSASTHDKVMIDMQMSLDTVPLDGGQTKDHAVYMDEEYYVPGLKEQLQGLKKGDSKDFKLAFPKEHYQKNTAGREVDFHVAVKDVFELQPPEFNDTFAQTIGQTTLAGLKELIKTNLTQEAEMKEAERQELELLEKALALTRFGDIPDLLVNEETIKMLRELEDGITRQGMDFNDYLQKLGKTRDALRLDIIPEALKRVKVALMIKNLGAVEKIAVSEDEVDAEVERVLTLYKNAPEQHEQIKSSGARDYLEGVLRNRKVIARLKAKAQLTS